MELIAAFVLGVVIGKLLGKGPLVLVAKDISSGAFSTSIERK